MAQRAAENAKNPEGHCGQKGQNNPRLGKMCQSLEQRRERERWDPVDSCNLLMGERG